MGLGAETLGLGIPPDDIFVASFLHYFHVIVHLAFKHPHGCVNLLTFLYTIVFLSLLKIGLHYCGPYPSLFVFCFSALDVFCIKLLHILTLHCLFFVSVP